MLVMATPSCPVCTRIGRPNPSKVVFHWVVVVLLTVVLMVAVCVFGGKDRAQRRRSVCRDAPLPRIISRSSEWRAIFRSVVGRKFAGDHAGLIGEKASMRGRAFPHATL